MSAWARLYILASSWIKRPAVWLGGLLTAVVAAFVTTNLLTPVQTFLAEKTAEKACQYRQKQVARESQFTILVSPLAHDPDKLHTEKIMQALLSEEGFLAIPLCEPFNVDLLTDTQSARDDMRKRAKALITEKQADLLLFGDVSEQGKAVLIYAFNEHGGCDLHPEPTKIKQGILGSDFTAEEKEKLIEVSLEQIQSACLNQSSMDWPLFAKRMKKMELFLNHFDFSQPKYLDFASSYIDAVRLLYEHGQGENWFSSGEEFARRLIPKYPTTSKKLHSLYKSYGDLLSIKFRKTTDQDSLDAAIGAYDKAISLDPDDDGAYLDRGHAYLDKGDWDRAIADYGKTIELDPKNADDYATTDAYANRGHAYLAKGNWKRAIADYDKAIGLDPKNADAHANRGHAYLAKGDFDRAIEDFDKAISLDPKKAVSYGNRGYAYLAKGDFDRAIEDFDKAIGLDPKYAEAYNNRGSAYRKKGDFDRAIADYDKAISLDPNDGVAYNNRGLAYSDKGDFDRAIVDYTKAIELDPKDASYYEDRGEAYSKKGDRDRAVVDYDKAIGLYGQAIQLDSRNAALWNERCSARAITGQLQQALSDCNQSLDLEPNNADARDSRAFVYLKMGKLKEAIADYNIALGLDPKRADSLYGRGVAKLKKGDTDSGNSDIESAKRIQPDIADEFQRYGVQLTQLSQSPPRSQASRAHRSRRQAD